MELNNILQKLNLDLADSRHKDDTNSYIFTLDNSDDYSKMYSTLDNMSEFDLDESNVIVTEHANIMTYYSDNFNIELQANFDADTYKVLITEVGED